VSTSSLYAGRRVALLVALIALAPAMVWAQTLPAGWATFDVGEPTIPGYATYESQTYTVSGAGAGIGGGMDRFTFVYRTLTGDGTIIARVASLPNTTPNAQAGVMIRESLHHRAAHASFLLSRTNELMFKRRTPLVRSRTEVSTVASPASTMWLKLDRRSDLITASWSTNGSAWTNMGTAAVPLNNVVYVGLAVTSSTEVAAVRATLTNVLVTSLSQSGGALPTGWTSGDVGSPVQAGSAAYESGTFALTGSGTGISGYSDQFRFTYTRVDGDVDIVARVRDLGNTDTLAKAGVMIRDSLTPNGAHASMFVTAEGRTRFQRRARAGAGTGAQIGSRTQAAPVWLKLSARAGIVTGFQSIDGATWSRVDGITLTLPSPYYVGLAVTSQDETVTVTTNVDNVSVHAVAPTDNEAPTVALGAPSNGATYTAPASITVSATAADSDGTVARVDFYRDATLIASDTSSPYSVTWTNAAAGSYALTAVATDEDGASTTSIGRTITVNQPPSVSLSAPANGATYTAPASITITATASDADGSIARVDFFRGSTLIASDSSSPYSITWNNVSAGSYSLTAVAVDDDNTSTTSAARNVTVNPASTTQRNAVFTPSPEHNTLVTSYLLEIFAAGANPATATPIASRNLGKPPVVNGECTVDVTATIDALAPGNYQGTLSAVGNGGSSRGAPATFTR
jgi:regulation of enolase protein 1 (concanavalin A-like superfamily)